MSNRKVSHTRRFAHPELGEVVVRFMKDGTTRYDLSQEAFNTLGVDAECHFRQVTWWLKILGARIPVK